MGKVYLYSCLSPGRLAGMGADVLGAEIFKPPTGLKPAGLIFVQNFHESNRVH